MSTVIIGNWKMAPSNVKDAQKLALTTRVIAKRFKKIPFVVCVPFPFLSTVSKLTGTVSLGAQRVSMHGDTPHTGEVSAEMLKRLGVSYCIVGHSEMRSDGQTNEHIREQTLRLLEKKITPILCVGETTRDTHGWYLSAVKEQLETVFGVVPKSALKHIVIAYEPVWAIGKRADREATPAECHEMVIYIRKVLRDLFSEKLSTIPRIIYGGSVDEKNAKQFISDGKAEGLLLGRLSLEPKRLTILADSLLQQ